MDVLIVVPTLGDRLELLRRSLESIASQQPRPRIVVIGARCTNDLEQVASEFGATLLQQRTRGQSAAINEAWAADDWRSDATGWLGDDDLLAPNSIAVTVAALRRRGRASMVHGRCEVIDERGERQLVIRNGWIGSVLAGWGMNLIAQPGSLFRTAFVREVGGVDPQLRYAMDIDLYQKLRRCGPIIAVPRIVASFRAHPGSVSTAAADAAAAEARMVLKRYRSMPRWVDGPVELLAVKASKAVFEVTKRLPA